MKGMSGQQELYGTDQLERYCESSVTCHQNDGKGSATVVSRQRECWKEIGDTALGAKVL